jgi:hypothetical protein
MAPYDEIELDCAMCDGAGCHLCNRTGGVYVKAEPVTLDDLEEMDAAVASLARARMMRQFDATIAAIKQWVEGTR